MPKFWKDLRARHYSWPHKRVAPLYLDELKKKTALLMKEREALIALGADQEDIREITSLLQKIRVAQEKLQALVRTNDFVKLRLAIDNARDVNDAAMYLTVGIAEIKKRLGPKKS